MLVMAHIDLSQDSPHQRSAYPFSSIDTSVNTDTDADARCGQGLRQVQPLPTRLTMHIVSELQIEPKRTTNALIYL